MRYFVQGRLPNITPMTPVNIGPAILQSGSFEYNREYDTEWTTDADSVERVLQVTLGLLWNAWTSPQRTSVRHESRQGPSLESYLPMSATIVETLGSEPIVDPCSCFDAVFEADDDLMKLLALYIDALGTRSPRGGDYFRAWAFALVIDAWEEGKGSWDKRCRTLVLALNSAGYEVSVTGSELAQIRHGALKFRNWRSSTHDPEDLRQLARVARGYLLLRLGLLDSDSIG